MKVTSETIHISAGSVVLGVQPIKCVSGMGWQKGLQSSTNCYMIDSYVDLLQRRFRCVARDSFER